MARFMFQVALFFCVAATFASAQQLSDVCELSGGTWSTCASPCPTTCDNFLDGPIPCITLCVVGCVCPSGFVLSESGECIEPSECSNAGELSPSVEPEQEICESTGGTWSTCASPCPITCDNFLDGPIPCITLCVVGCVCPSGFVLNESGECVKPNECPNAVQSPPPVVDPEQESCESSGGIWSGCASPCPITCDNFLDGPIPCITLCVVGCICPSGFVLSESGECIEPSECPNAVQSPPPVVDPEQESCESSGGTWSDCASACPTTCDNFLDGPIPCITLCVVGCVCPPGFVLSESGECIEPSECPNVVQSPPPVVDPEQEICECTGGTWSSCASACPTTCENLGQLIPCPAVCAIGCSCPPGTVLDPVYGCKDESFCQPTFCCQATTPDCLACNAGVTEDIFCKVNPEVIGCEDSDPCDDVECPQGNTCFQGDCVDLCILTLCPEETLCIGGQCFPFEEACSAVDCPFGSSCTLVDTPCAAILPCPPIPQCICDEIIDGDFNANGEIAVDDIVQVIDVLLNGAQVPDCIFQAIDVDDNGLITVADIVIIVEAALGL